MIVYLDSTDRNFREIEKSLRIGKSFEILFQKSLFCSKFLKIFKKTFPKKNF